MGRLDGTFVIPYLIGPFFLTLLRNLQRTPGGAAPSSPPVKSQLSNVKG